MSLVTNLFQEQPFIILPTSFQGRLGLILWVLILAFMILRYRGYQRPWSKTQAMILMSLVFSVPITNFFLGIQLDNINNQPFPGGLLETRGLYVMFFSALPWVLAGGLLGPLPAALLGIGSGTILALWNTHSPFTPLEISFLAIVYSIFSMQRYRNSINTAIRQPFIAALITSFLFPIIFLLDGIYLGGGDITARLDYSLTNVFPLSLAAGIPLWIAGLFGYLVIYTFPNLWGGQPPWKTSPSDESLITRSLRNLLPIIILLIIIPFFFGWKNALRQSEIMIIDQMNTVAESTASSVPPFLDLGRRVISEIADSLPTDLNSESELEIVLEEKIQQIPYFTQLFVIDKNGNSLGSYPDEDFDPVDSGLNELSSIDLAFNGFQNPANNLTPANSMQSALISFVSPIRDEFGSIPAVIIGRTELESNPFANGILANLSALSEVNGIGFLMDDDKKILYRDNSVDLLSNLPDFMDIEDGISKVDKSDGNTQIMNYQPIVGSSWSILLAVPMKAVQRIAIIQALPFIGTFLFSSLAILLVIFLGLRPASTSIRSLEKEVNRVSLDRLDFPLGSEDVDEIGQLRNSIDRMRSKFKDRIDELDRLLKVSHGVVESSTLQNAFNSILEAGLSMGASSSRILLSSSAVSVAVPSLKYQSHFGLGRLSHVYLNLDDKILELVETQDRLVVPNTSRTTMLKFDENEVMPGSLLAIAMRQNEQYLGVLWIAYSQEHTFTPEEVKFMTTLANQAALVVKKNMFLIDSQFDRQRLSVILESLPIPVFIVGLKDQFLYANSEVREVFNIDQEEITGEPVKDLIRQPDLINFIQVSSLDSCSGEIQLSDGKYYLVSVSPLQIEETNIGQLCFLYDITEFKESDSLKSVFVATASHDLRSSLTVLRGYTTMLTTVGELNNKQESYVRKLLSGIDNMYRLVNNLLDLGRIEADIRLRLQTLPVQEILNEVIESLQIKANQKRVEIHFEPDKLFLPIIEADHAMLYQAFLNLLDNAIKFSPDGKGVWIRTRSSDENIIFSFEDQGIGVSAIDQPRLFDRFFRSAQREAKRESGSGLGLAIVKSIAERHGGKVWARSELGKGSTFFFEIPIRQKNLGRVRE